MLKMLLLIGFLTLGSVMHLGCEDNNDLGDQMQDTAEEVTP